MAGSVPSLPARVNINAGGKGGTVAAIIGVFVVGYLYYTRRLPNVLQAITTPATAWNAATASQPIPMLMPGATAPVNPVNPKVRIIINYPPNYNLPPDTLEVFANQRDCSALVYATVLRRTQSPQLAAMAITQSCGALPP